MEMLDSVILGVSLGLYYLSGRTFRKAKRRYLFELVCIYYGIKNDHSCDTLHGSE